MSKLIFKGRRRVGSFIVLLLGPLLSGCITIGANEQIALPDPEDTIVQAKHTELATLAKALKDTPWPKAPVVSVSDRVLSGEASAVKFDFVDNYLEVLTHESSATQTNPVAPSSKNTLSSIVLRDVETQLATAGKLADKARQFSRSRGLTNDDISIVESSILALRDNRRIFVETLKQLDSNGDPVEDDQIRSVKTAFINSGRALGAAADLMADNLASNFNDYDNNPIYSEAPNLSNPVVSELIKSPSQ